ncbi:hypothetical protein OG894_00915 [Streptomyces sp. NBC_01724]|uniref:hypothetical protein n=1 Tax=Streptomyces sp. NBC_01724 TaxID=2975922 RepID=UPI002E304808|nr:hypothetical protein [Streptomyces sp. NBC_01724]
MSNCQSCGRIRTGGDVRRDDQFGFGELLAGQCGGVGQGLGRHGDGDLPGGEDPHEGQPTGEITRIHARNCARSSVAWEVVTRQLFETVAGDVV